MGVNFPESCFIFRKVVRFSGKTQMPHMARHIQIYYGRATAIRLQNLKNFFHGAETEMVELGVGTKIHEGREKQTSTLNNKWNPTPY